MFTIRHPFWLPILPDNPSRCLSQLSFSTAGILNLLYSPQITYPPTQFSHSQHVFFASYLMGKRESTQREITQLPVITLIDFHHKYIHPFLFAISLIQRVTLLQPKSSSLSQALYSPSSLSTLGAHFLLATPSSAFTAFPSILLVPISI